MSGAVEAVVLYYAIGSALFVLLALGLGLAFLWVTQ